MLAKSREGAIAAKNANLLFRIYTIIMNRKDANHKIFSAAASKLEVLVTSTPSTGRNKKVNVEYGDFQAKQNNSLKVELCVSGQLAVAITDSAPAWFAS